MTIRRERGLAPGGAHDDGRVGARSDHRSDHRPDHRHGLGHGWGPGDRHINACQQGFTLIEILLATLIFLAGVSGVYALLSTGLSMQQDGLELGRLERRLDQLVHHIELELSAGLHFDADSGGWVPVEAARLPDGTWYSVDFVGEEDDSGEGTLLATIRVAGTEAGLRVARPVGHALTPGQTQAGAIRAWRARRAAAEATPGTPDPPAPTMDVR